MFLKFLFRRKSSSKMGKIIKDKVYYFPGYVMIEANLIGEIPI
jgi:hypothetical protein